MHINMHSLLLRSNNDYGSLISSRSMVTYMEYSGLNAGHYNGLIDNIIVNGQHIDPI